MQDPGTSGGDAVPRVLKPPPGLPDEGILVGYSLEHEHRTAPIGFRYAPRPSVGVDRDEYLEPILHTGGGHLLTVAPTGSGKGVSCIIPTLLRFPGPVIVIDPKGENYAVTADRRRALGQEVILLDPMGITGSEDVSSLNPLDLVDPRHPVGIDDAAMLASLLTGGLEKLDPRNLFWYQRGEQLATGLIQHIALSRGPGARNLSELRELLTMPAEAFMEMAKEEMLESHDPNVRSVAGMLTNPAVEMVGSIMGMAQNSLEFLRGDLVRRSTDTSSFDLDAVTRGEPLSIYLVIPPDKLESHRNLLRVWIGSLMAALMRRRASPPHRTLFILDEAAQLGSLDQLRQAVTLMRGYGLQTWSFWQDLSQLQNLYPADWETMYNNCQVHQSFGFTNLKSARAAADIAGFYDALEVLRLDADEMILSIAGDEAVIARKPNYLSDPAFDELYAENPFYRAATEPVPEPRRPQRRYTRPSRSEALDPDAAGDRVAEWLRILQERGEGTAEDTGPGALSSRTTVVAPAAGGADDVPRGVALEGYDRVEVVPPGDTGPLLRDIGRAVPGDEWNPYRTVARRVVLPFYRGYALYEVLDTTRTPPREYVIRSPHGTIRLDWSRDTFYALNRRAPIVLTDDSVLEYVKLFFRFVRGRHGHFHVAETVDDLPVPWTVTPEARAALASHLHPLELRETREDGTRVLEARFYFGDALFSSLVEVDPEGVVTLTDESQIVESVERLAAGGGSEAAAEGSGEPPESPDGSSGGSGSPDDLEDDDEPTGPAEGT